jgi:hypothetical protein
VYDFCDGNARGCIKGIPACISRLEATEQACVCNNTLMSKTDSINSPQPIYSFEKTPIFCPCLHNYPSTYPEILQVGNFPVFFSVLCLTANAMNFL